MPIDDNDDNDDIQSFQFKCILLGDGTVGKTSICCRFAEDSFTQQYKQTVGVDFFIRRIELPKYHIALQLWDIGGQSIGSKMITNYITGAHVVLLCYDITNYDSFANLEDWYRLVLKTFEGQPMPYTVLVGNKIDLRHLTAVKSQLHSQFAAENEMASFFMSAKSGDQVKQAFYTIAASVAGITIPQEELIAQPSIIPATIIDYKRHDEDINGGDVLDYSKPKKGVLNNCNIS
jgi:Ras-related protein Rab-28